MAAPQYTSCVDRKAYKDPGLPKGGFFESLGSAIIGGGLDILLKVCDYILHGKLVCLGGDRCAIGRVASFETVDDKSGFEKIDNDFSINLALCPNPLSGLQPGIKNRIPNHHGEEKNKQGELIKEQADMPQPREVETDSNKVISARFTGTFTKIHTFLSLSNPIPEKIANESDSTTWHVPVFHCEIEGERANLVCAAANALWGPISDTVCRIKIFGIPIGKLVCFLISVPFALAILPILAAAWVAGSSDNRDFDGGGDLKADDLVLIRGRWVYDAGHSGWNELHPVKHIQKIPDDKACTWESFDELHDRWCGETAKVPPHASATPGMKPQDMTPEQEAIYDAQLAPENRWVFHPEIDGCEPMDNEPEGPIIK
jgi:hypothetical protein